MILTKLAKQRGSTTAPLSNYPVWTARPRWKVPSELLRGTWLKTASKSLHDRVFGPKDLKTRVLRALKLGRPSGMPRFSLSLTLSVSSGPTEMLLSD